MIHVIGDSHVSVFNGTWELSKGCPYPNDEIPGFRTYNTSSHLAYNLGIRNHPVNALVFSVVRSIPLCDTLLLIFGEIDCRNHLCKQKLLQNKPIDVMVRECVEIYVNSIIEIAESRKLIFWGPHPLYYTIEEKGCTPQPFNVSFGSYEEINYAKFLFNLFLSKICKDKGLPFGTMYFKMVEGSCQFTKSSYIDGSHLLPKSLPDIMNILEGMGVDVNEARKYIAEHKKELMLEG